MAFGIRTRAQAIKEFRECVMPSVREIYEKDGVLDYPARSEAWNNWIDAEVDYGVMPEKAREWAQPKECWAPWERKIKQVNKV